MLNFFSKIKGAPIMRLVTETEPAVYKGSPVVTKRAEFVAQVGCYYGRKVAKATGRPYTGGNGRPWGVLSANRVVVTHNGQMYIQYFPLQAGEITWYVDGQLSTYEQAKRYLRPSSSSPEAVKVRTVKLSNILAVHCGKTRLSRGN